MSLGKDKFPVVCHLGKVEGDPFVCPALNIHGACDIYTNAGVRVRERWGLCSYKELRRPITTVTKMPTLVRKKLNPLKASKRGA